MDFIFGCVGGLFATSICYPIDTIKTNVQSSSKYNLIGDIKLYSSKTLYRGMLSPLSGIMLEKSLLFGVYNNIKDYGLGTATSGFLSGIIATMVVTPFELIKVNSQTRKISSTSALKYILKNYGIAGLGRGWTATWFREVPGYTIYFPAYEYFSSLGYSTPLVGALTGVSSWIVIYPSDPIKTHMQYNNKKFIETVKYIYETDPKMFYRGYTWGLIRAAIFHSAVIYGYDNSKYCFKRIQQAL